MITIWLMYFIAAFAASVIFIAAGWHSKRLNGLVSADGPHDLLNKALHNTAEVGVPEIQADVSAVLRLALKRLAPLMASQSVQADIAVPAGLLVRMRAAALLDLLEELLAIVLQNAPASRILLTATTHGERIYMGITDDTPGADADVRRAGVRGLMERIAMRGGVLDIDVRPAEGTTMTLRLPAVRPDKADQVTAEPAAAESARGPASQSIPLFSSDTSR